MPEPPVGWSDRILILFEEDDARPEGYERAHEAFKRIAGRDPSTMPEVAHEDRGDWFARLFIGGWVLIGSCEGGAVGIVVDEKCALVARLTSAARREGAEAMRAEIQSLRERLLRLGHHPDESCCDACCGPERSGR